MCTPTFKCGCLIKPFGSFKMTNMFRGQEFQKLLKFPSKNLCDMDLYGFGLGWGIVRGLFKMFLLCPEAIVKKKPVPSLPPKINRAHAT